MAQDNRKFDAENPSREDAPNNIQEITGSERSKYGDHPLLGKDRKPLAEELLRSPERPKPDPMIHPPHEEARPSSRNVVEIRSSAPRDPNTAYQPPNPALVIPPANITLKLLGSIVGLILFTCVLLLLFHNWMSPGPRHPGAQKPAQTLQQKIP
jgi:hypothetical protein